MRRHEQGGAGLRDEIEGEAERLVSRGLVEIAGRLVGEQQARPPRQRPPNRDALLLAAGKLFGITRFEPGEAQAAHQLGLPKGIVTTAETRLKGEIIGDGEAGDQVELLENHAQMVAAQGRPLGFAPSCDANAIETNLAAIGVIEPGDQMEQCALAAAGLAHQRHCRASRQGEIDALEDGQRPLRRRVGFCEARNREQGRRGGCLDVLAYTHARLIARPSTSNRVPGAVSSLDPYEARLLIYLYMKPTKAKGLIMNFIRNFFIFASLLVTLAFAPLRADVQTAPPEKPTAARELPAEISTTHVMMLGGEKMAFTARAGAVRLQDAHTGAPQADVGFVAYERAETKADARPIAFFFNGGPGASSAWLGLGAASPWRLRLTEGYSPSDSPMVTENAESWLAFADLVFIDPPGTGYSRILGGDDLAKRFYSVGGDIDALATVVRKWLAAHRHRSAPVFLVGESYGGFRAVKLVEALREHENIGVLGLFLISPALDFGWLEGTRNLLNYAALLPSLTAVDRSAKDRQALADVEAYASGDYVADLLKGVRDPAILRASVTASPGSQGSTRRQCAAWPGASTENLSAGSGAEPAPKCLAFTMGLGRASIHRPFLAYRIGRTRRSTPCGRFLEQPCRG